MTDYPKEQVLKALDEIIALGEAVKSTTPQTPLIFAQNRFIQATQRIYNEIIPNLESLEAEMQQQAIEARADRAAAGRELAQAQARLHDAEIDRLSALVRQTEQQRETAVAQVRQYMAERQITATAYDKLNQERDGLPQELTAVLTGNKPVPGPDSEPPRGDEKMTQ